MEEALKITKINKTNKLHSIFLLLLKDRMVVLLGKIISLLIKFINLTVTCKICLKELKILLIEMMEMLITRNCKNMDRKKAGLKKKSNNHNGIEEEIPII